MIEALEPNRPLPSIADLWDEFAKKILPDACSDLQRRETRRAFYAGFHVAILALKAVADQVPENEAVQQAEKWFGECREFVAGIAEGRA